MPVKLITRFRSLKWQSTIEAYQSQGTTPASLTRSLIVSAGTQRDLQEHYRTLSSKKIKKIVLTTSA